MTDTLEQIAMHDRNDRTNNQQKQTSTRTNEQHIERTNKQQIERAIDRSIAFNYVPTDANFVYCMCTYLLLSALNTDRIWQKGENKHDEIKQMIQLFCCRLMERKKT